MKKLWKIAQGMKPGHPLYAQELLFLRLCTGVFALAGAALWMLVRRFALSSPDWLICFIGYPAFFGGVLGGLLFLYQGRHLNRANESEENNNGHI